jgi:predicted nucleic acid-binding Zn ribbon protein
MVDAKKVRDMAAKKANQFMGQVSGKVPPHKHCRICQEPIPVSAEPRVCKDQTCIDKNARDEKNQRSVRIWMFVLFGLFAAGFILPIFFR